MRSSYQETCPVLVRLLSGKKRKFNTFDLTEGNAVDSWRSWLSNEFQPVSIKDYTLSDFDVDCEMATIGDIDIVTFTGAAQSFVSVAVYDTVL